jgi:hypothetical protein
MRWKARRRWRSWVTAAALVAALALLPPPPPAPAGCYPYHSTSYYAPSYYAPSYQPAYYPSTYYSPTYYEQPVKYVKEYVDREVLYPYPVKAYVNPDYYFSTQDFYRDKLLVDAVAGRVAQMMGPGAGGTGAVGAALGYGLGMGGQATYTAGQSGYQVQQGCQMINPAMLQALVAALQQGGVGGQQGPAGPQGPTGPQGLQGLQGPQGVHGQSAGEGAGGQSGGQQGAAGGQEPARKFTYLSAPLGEVNTRLVESMKANCTRCHGGNPDRLDLRDPSRVTVADRYLAVGLVYHRDPQMRMPKNGVALPEQELQLYQEWADRAYATARARR